MCVMVGYGLHELAQQHLSILMFCDYKMFS